MKKSPIFLVLISIIVMLFILKTSIVEMAIVSIAILFLSTKANRLTFNYRIVAKGIVGVFLVVSVLSLAQGLF